MTTMVDGIEQRAELRHAEMEDSGNTTAFAVSEVDDATAYHTASLAAGSLGGGWTFDAGGAGTNHAIASIADGADSGVDVAVTTSTDHGLAVGDIISQSGLTSAVYTGFFKVKAVISSAVYEVAAVYTATDTGTMDQAAVLTCPAGGAGSYLCVWMCDATNIVTDETFDFALHLDAASQPKTSMRRKFDTAGDVGSMGSTAILTIADGEKISWMVKNTDSAGNIVVRLHVVLICL